MKLSIALVMLSVLVLNVRYLLVKLEGEGPRRVEEGKWNLKELQERNSTRSKRKKCEEKHILGIFKLRC